MVVVSAVAFAVGAVSLYYGAQALRTRRAIRRLDAGGGEQFDTEPGRRLGHPTDWLDPPDERGAGEETATESAAEPTEGTTARRDDVAFERGFVLLVLGVVCILFGVFAL
ncbi:hypothetical protein DVK02_09515 [Halobellus sp. Atlit-31R]|nr:hypothetical protein DVK02_09515 [Halobellus sp. Atlit-31R]